MCLPLNYCPFPLRLATFGFIVRRFFGSCEETKLIYVCCKNSVSEPFPNFFFRSLSKFHIFRDKFPNLMSLILRATNCYLLEKNLRSPNPNCLRNLSDIQCSSSITNVQVPFVLRNCSLCRKIFCQYFSRKIYEILWFCLLNR